MSVEFRMLGPLEVRTASGPVRLAGPRLNRLLAVLLIHRDRVVAADYLVDAIWNERPPATARRQLQNCLSALRRALPVGGDGSPVVVADGPGYRLRPGTGTVDATRFDQRLGVAHRLAGDGRTAQAADEIRAALRLWRGAALTGITGPVIVAAAAELDEKRIVAQEECFDLELRHGRPDQLVGELGSLVAAHPLRERLVGQLMLALYHSGRRPEALAVYHRLRTSLSDELGLDPGARVQQVHAAILNGVPVADLEPGPAAPQRPTTPLPAGATGSAPPPAAASPAQLPHDLGSFAGRDSYLKRLHGLLPAGRAGSDRSGSGAVMPIVAVTGMAGVGKTALAVHWAHVVAHLFPDGQLFVNLRGFDPGGTVVHPAEAIRGFLDAFGVRPERIPAGIDAQVALYRSVLAGRRVLVVLDNARDAEQVRPLLPGAAGCLAVVTSRDQLAGLVAADSAEPMCLHLPTTGEARELLNRRLGPERTAADEQSADEIITCCGRLPLALAIVAARAALHQSFPLATLVTELRAARGRLDNFVGTDPTTDVRAVFSWSYRELSHDAAQLFRLLALHPGPDVAAPAAASLTGLPPAGVRPLLIELTRAHLLAEHAVDRYGMHDLLRAYAGELVLATDTGADRRAARRRVFDHYLHTGRCADRRLDPYRDPIAVASPQPGVSPQDFGNHDTALAWFTDELPVTVEAVQQAAADGLDAHAWQIAWTLAYFLERRGQWPRWQAVQRTALDAARRLADPAGQAHAHRGLGRVSVHLDRLDDARAHLGYAQRLYREAGDPAGEARIHFDLCWISDRQGRHDESLQHSTSALGLFRAAGHRSGQARALTNMGWSRNYLGEHERAIEHGEQALVIQREIGDRFGEADTLDNLAWGHHHLGRHGEAVACYESALAMWRQLGDRFHEADVLCRLGDTHHAAGDRAAARTAWQAALETFDELGHPDAEQVRIKVEHIGH